MGDLGAIFGASWAVVGRRKSQKKQMQSSLNNLRKINDFAPLRAFLEELLEASWGPLGQS